MSETVDHSSPSPDFDFKSFSVLETDVPEGEQAESIDGSTPDLPPLRSLTDIATDLTQARIDLKYDYRNDRDATGNFVDVNAQAKQREIDALVAEFERSQDMLGRTALNGSEKQSSDS